MPDHDARRAARGRRAVLLCVLLALVAWSGAVLRGGFAFDDAEAIRANPVVEGSLPWWTAFERDYWDHLAPAGHYRPIATLTLRLDRALWGEDAPAGWHATNVALHALVVLLLGLLLLRVVESEPTRTPLPWLGLALFACHPALADAVAWISGRSTMLSAAPGLAGALALAVLLDPREARAGPSALLVPLAAAAGLLGALLSKEDGVVFALLYGLLALRAGRRALVPVVTGCALALAAYLALRAHALGSPWPSSPYAPLRDTPLLARLVIAGRALLELARLAILPAGYPPSYDGARFLRYTPSSIPQVPPLGYLGWLPWIALLACGALALRRGRARVLGASASLAALSLAPLLQVVPSGTLLAPRFLYLPLCFSAPLVHALVSRLAPRARSAIAVVVLGACCVACWSRAGVYASRASYHEAVLQERPDDAPAWNELGLAREADGDLDGARAAFERSTRLDPGYSRAWSNLGRLALDAGRLDEAERCLTRAARSGPSNPIAQVNLGALMLRLGRPLEALEPYRQATRLAPRLGAAWRGLGRALAEAGERDAAREALERALALDPADALARELRDGLDGR